MNNKDLINGLRFNFDNEQDAINNNHDDVRMGTIEYCDTFGFTIWFNGTIIDSRKTFKSLEKRVDLLFNKWSLNWTTIEDENGDLIKQDN